VAGRRRGLGRHPWKTLLNVLRIPGVLDADRVVVEIIRPGWPGEARGRTVARGSDVSGVATPEHHTCAPALCLVKKVIDFLESGVGWRVVLTLDLPS